MIAQGMLQYLSMTCERLVWQHFGTWVRTIRRGVVPSEMIVSISLKNALPEFLHRGARALKFRKFILENIDPERTDGQRFVA